jgi:uncharacterized damage-inducible protein DinB
MYHPPMERTLESTVLHVSRNRLLHDYPGQIHACLEVLTDEQAWWRPNERANSVANLVLHLAGSNRYYFGHVLAGEEDRRDRDAEFAARGGHTVSDLGRVWADSVATVSRVLETLDASRLMDSTDRTGKTTTVVQVLMHVTHHNAVHLGQIVWVTKMQQPGTIDDIWMQMRK